MRSNSRGEVSRASTTSRLSSCRCGNSTSRSSKKCIRSRRPSQFAQVSPTDCSSEAVRPTSSANSRRAPPLASPRAGHRHQANATRPDTSTARARERRRHRRPLRLPHAVDASVATRHGRPGTQGGKLSARRRREVTQAGLAQNLTYKTLINARVISNRGIDARSLF